MSGLIEIATVLLIAMSPLAELRGSIPVALFVFHMDPVTAFALSIIGNMIPVIPILLLFDPIVGHLRRFKVFDRLFDWLFARTRRHGAGVEKYGALGLAIFVAVPLPMTGAWTGSLLAFLFGMKLRYSVPSIFLGVLGAGVIVMSTSLGVIHFIGL
jgi:uncharacterized membrane protein